MAALWPGRSNRTSPDSVRGDRLVPLVLPIALLTARRQVGRAGLLLTRAYAGGA
jgi:hypothetical protein